MNNVKKSFRILSALIVFSVAAFMVSCSDDEETLASADKQSVSSEASTDSYFEDAEDLSSTAAFATNGDLGGRTGELDSRLASATITFSEGSNEQGGTITIDFGSGTTVNGVERKGKIIISYEGSRRVQGSSHVITFDGFYVNGVKIEGTRTVTVSEVNENYITHHIELEDGKITWDEGTANETSATRTSDHYRKWLHNGTPLIPTGDEIHLLADGTAYGVNREGVEYAMEIQSDIVFKASCLVAKKFLPSSGVKVLTVGGNAGRIITVDYGTGDCDNSITVTINGVTRTVTVSRG